MSHKQIWTYSCLLLSSKLLEVRWQRCKFYILPLGFIPGGGPLSGSCYKAFTAPETWNNAEAKCKRLGTQLVKIESAEENDFLTRTFLKAPEGTYWIGLSDQMIEGKWIWTDESLLGKYTNWGKSNPNNLGDNQDCGHILKGSFQLQSHYFRGYDDGEWNDLECSFALGYICEQLSP